jgi:hypothetical protein
MDPNLLKTFVPIVVVAGVLALRFRSMNRVRPLNPGTLWVLPAILIALAGVTLFAQPPGVAGLSIAAFALVVGGLIGWQRGRLIQIERDATTGQLTQRASPAAMILLLGIIALRFAARSYFDMTPGTDGRMSQQALIVTDALLLFAVGLIGMTRIEMALRARRMLS